MCGITAFSGKEEALPFLLQGLSRLEYRGYDSAGVTLVDKDKLFTVKTKGRLQNLIERLDQAKPRGCVGIGHTRWATHGIPSILIHILIRIMIIQFLWFIMELLKIIVI